MTEYFHLASNEKEWVGRFKIAQHTYREANPKWRFIPKLLGATTTGIVVAADIVSANVQLSYRPPSWTIWAGSIYESELPEPAPIFSALTDLDRGNSGTIGRTPTEPEHIQDNIAKLRQWEECGRWFPGIADGYEACCRMYARYGELFLPTVFKNTPECPPRLGSEDILPIMGQDFYMN